MEKSKKITMRDRVYDYMKTFGSITTLEAFKDLGCTRLSEYIRQLRIDFEVKDEWISSKNRYGDKVMFKKFWLA